MCLMYKRWYISLTDDSIINCNFESECSQLENLEEDGDNWLRLSASKLPGVRDHTLVSGIYMYFHMIIECLESHLHYIHTGF